MTPRPLRLEWPPSWPRPWASTCTWSPRTTARGGLHVAGGPVHPGTTSALDEAEGLLAIIASDLRTQAKDVTTSAVAGKAPEVICEEAERQDAELIVVGNKRMHGPTKVLGAVAGKVASHAPCDVYIAHTT